MFSFLDTVVGIAIGAAFSPLWMKIYNFGVSKVKDWLNTPEI